MGMPRRPSTASRSIPTQVRVYEGKMPQNEYMERWRKLHGQRLDTQERVRKRLARESHKRSYDAQNLRGHRAKMMQETRRVEKILMRKKIKVHEERNIKSDGSSSLPSEPVP